MESMTDTTAHPSSRRYPPEIKERAVRLVLETIERTGEQGAVSRVAHQLGIGVESLRAWVRQPTGRGTGSSRSARSWQSPRRAITPAAPGHPRPEPCATQS